MISRPQPQAIVTGLVAWASLVGLARWWGTAIIASGRDISLTAAPLYGIWDLRLSWRVAPAVIVAVLAVALAPAAARRLPWTALLLAAAATTGGWAVALATTNGWEGVVGPLETRFDYLAVLPRVDGVGSFLRTFTDQIRSYPIHVKGHPPGMVLVLVGLDRIGLGGSAWAAATVVAGGGASVAAALVATRELAGEEVARRAAPFMALAPAAVYIASSADALFAGVALSGTALLVLATGRHDRTGDVQSLAGGALLGFAVHLSYGLVLLGPVVVVVCVARRRARPLVVAGVGALAVLGCFLAAGFSWFEGLDQTRGSYRRGVASRRPYEYFVVSNLAAFAIVVGPAVGAALAVLRDRRLWLVVGAALGVVAVADVSGLSKGEVERIWLFLVPLVVASTAALVSSVRAGRAWLALQVVAGLVLQVSLDTIW